MHYLILLSLAIQNVITAKNQEPYLERLDIDSEDLLNDPLSQIDTYADLRHFNYRNNPSKTYYHRSEPTRTSNDYENGYPEANFENVNQPYSIYNELQDDIENRELKDLNIDANYKLQKPRRFLDWFSNLLTNTIKNKISNATTPVTQTTTTELTTEPSTTESSIAALGTGGLSTGTLPLQEIEIYENILSATLKNISEVLGNLNENIEKQNKIATIIYNNIYSQLLQQSLNNHEKNRSKRDLKLENKNKTTIDNVKVNVEVVEVKNSTVENNETQLIVTVGSTNATNCTDNLGNGRRTYDRVDEVAPSVVKTKLLSYLDETFNDIVTKIEPILKLKEKFSTNDMYKIGYIIANIDTLEVNINNLKKDMDLNKDKWDDSIILDLFDKVMMSNKVVINLLGKLQVYAKKYADVIIPNIRKDDK